MDPPAISDYNKGPYLQPTIETKPVTMAMMTIPTSVGRVVFDTLRRVYPPRHTFTADHPTHERH